MGRWKRRFGISQAYPIAFAMLSILIARSNSVAQQDREANVLQTPQVLNFAGPPTKNATSAPSIDPATLIRIPVTVIDDAGRCVESLQARDFSLSIDGEDRPIAWFKPNRATAAALGVLVDISQSMAFRSFSGRTYSKLPIVQDAIEEILDKLDAHDNLILATFARRFHILDDFTTDHRDLEERLPMLRVADQLDDFDGSGIYESLMKGISVLAHAPRTCDRRALLVFTDGGDSSSHGADDVIAKAQFAGVTVYNIVVQGFKIETDVFSIRSGLGRIAAETGGLTFTVNMWRDRDLIGSAVNEIASELDNQYVLGVPVQQWTSNALPVELTLLHHPGLRIRAPRVVRFRPSDFVHEASAPPVQILPE